MSVLALPFERHFGSAFNWVITYDTFDRIVESSES